MARPRWILPTPTRSATTRRVIGVVGFAHLLSHFFQLALPPLFPLLRAEFGTSYAVLGTLVGVYYAASGVTQFVSRLRRRSSGRAPGAAAGLGLAAGGHHRREPRSRSRLALPRRRADGHRQRRVSSGRLRDPQRQRRAAAAGPCLQLARHRRQPGLCASAGRELRARHGVRVALRAGRDGRARARRPRHHGEPADAPRLAPVRGLASSYGQGQRRAVPAGADIPVFPLFSC